jgi:DNA-binding response OmpR family regulator
MSSVSSVTKNKKMMQANFCRQEIFKKNLTLLLTKSAHNNSIIQFMSHILVIDDDPDILDALRFLLEDAGFTVITSQNGEYAEKLIKAKILPQLIILDVLLSGKDGRDICTLLKKNPSTRYIPIIMISAHPNVEKSIIGAGANAFIAKPFDVDDLLQKVGNLLKTS